MAVDWLRIRNDYINGGGSYRKLAEKYDVPFGTLREKAKDENWVSLREEYQHKVSIKTAQKSEEKLSDALSDEAATKVRIRGKLLGLAEKWIDAILEDGVSDTGDFRRMVQSCVDLGIADAKQDNQKEMIEGMQALADILRNPAPSRRIEDFE